MTKIFSSVLCLVVLTAFSGCGSGGPATVPVTGIVLLDDKPLEGAGVTFMSSTGIIATGTTDSAGKFTLTTIGDPAKAGAVPGKHKVGVAKSTNTGAAGAAQTYSDPKEMAVKMGGAMTSGVKQTFIVAQRFNSPATSGLTADVPAEGSQSIEIKVSAK
jgi:hypothetical protein